MNEVSLTKVQWKRRKAMCLMLGISLTKAQPIDDEELEKKCIEKGYLEART
jgi:hypothetical protein